MYVASGTPLADVAAGFGVALGFIVVIIIAAVAAYQLCEGLSPFSLWVKRRQEHKYKMAELSQQVKMKRDDPEYVRYLEEKGLM
jgi:hypothetical protein